MPQMLSVENLTISFRTDEGVITPVQGVTFSVDAGRTLGLVGESGSGKSISTKALMQLLPGTASLGQGTKITYTDKSGAQIALGHLKQGSHELRRIRGGELGMIFQEPMASFSPVYTIGNQMMEAIMLHRGMKETRSARLCDPDVEQGRHL